MAATPTRGARFDQFPQQPMSSAHGAQFDQFDRRTGSPHGPHFDEGFSGDQAGAALIGLDRIADQIRRLPDHHQRLLCDKLGWSQGQETGKSTSSLPAHAAELEDVHKAQEHDLSFGGPDADLHAALVAGIHRSAAARAGYRTVEKVAPHRGTVRDVAGDQVHKTLRELNGIDVAKVRHPQRSASSLDRGVQTLRELAGVGLDVTKVRGR